MADQRRYRFRIRLQLEPGRSLQDLEAVMSIDLANVGQCDIKPTSAATPLDGQWLSIVGPAVGTEEEAQERGEIALGSLLTVSLKRGFAILLQPQRLPGVLTDYGLHEYALNLFPQKNTLYRDRLGLTVFEEQGETAFVEVPAPGVLVTSQIGPLVEAWEREGPSRLTNRKLIAYDLYASARFEASARVRFLLLVVAIEALADQKPRPLEEVAVVRQLSVLVQQSGLSPERKNVLLGGISNFERGSIGQACAELISEGIAATVVEDKDSVTFFRNCYRLRSKIVHDAAAPDAYELLKMANRLEPTARSLLAWKLTTGLEQPSDIWKGPFAATVSLADAARRST